VTKARKPRLKVFHAQFGFYDTVVAAPSRAAAMRAWGIRQNLFVDGQARETSDEAAVAVAIAHPEVVLKRPVGSQGAFKVDPTGLPDVPDAPAKKVKARSTKAKAASPAPPPPDRSKLDAAEAALREVDDRRKAEEATLCQEQEALDAKRSAAQATYVEASKAATAAVVEARAAFRRAGGRD
jgi:colicin import membrane protein